MDNNNHHMAKSPTIPDAGLGASQVFHLPQQHNVGSHNVVPRVIPKSFGQSMSIPYTNTVQNIFQFREQEQQLLARTHPNQSPQPVMPSKLFGGSGVMKNELNVLGVHDEKGSSSAGNEQENNILMTSISTASNSGQPSPSSGLHYQQATDGGAVNDAMLSAMNYSEGEILSDMAGIDDSLLGSVANHSFFHGDGDYQQDLQLSPRSFTDGSGSFGHADTMSGLQTEQEGKYSRLFHGSMYGHSGCRVPSHPGKPGK